MTQNKESLERERAPKYIAAFVHASAVSLTLKLHAPGSWEYRRALEVAARPEVADLRSTLAFRYHQRCEPNYSLDSGTLALLEMASPHESVVRVKMALVKVLLLPRDGMLASFEKNYLELAGKCIWQDRRVDPETLYLALKDVTLDLAYPCFRRAFFRLEAQRQKLVRAEGGGECFFVPLAKDNFQKRIFANYFATLVGAKSFEVALHCSKIALCDLTNMFKTFLLVHTSFHRMLLARELSLLLPEAFPVDAGALLVNVGYGAARLVREAAGKPFRKNVSYKQRELLGDLHALHCALLDEMDLEFLEKSICPRGWFLDSTVHASCERRRFDDAVLRLEKKRGRPKRLRDEEEVEGRAAKRLQRIRLLWGTLGFDSVPSKAIPS